MPADAMLERATDIWEFSRPFWFGVLPTRETRVPSARYEPAVFDTARFNELANRWARETAALSSIEDIIEHESYREIIALGWPAVPSILSRLMAEPDHWFEALYEITGDDPVPEEAYGDMLAMAAAWLEWGREHGQI